jgi:hypothetical protein
MCIYIEVVDHPTQRTIAICAFETVMKLQQGLDEGRILSYQVSPSPIEKKYLASQKKSGFTFEFFGKPKKRQQIIPSGKLT